MYSDAKRMKNLPDERKVWVSGQVSVVYEQLKLSLRVQHDFLLSKHPRRVQAIRRKLSESYFGRFGDVHVCVWRCMLTLTSFYIVHVWKSLHMHERYDCMCCAHNCRCTFCSWSLLTGERKSRWRQNLAISRHDLAQISLTPEHNFYIINITMHKSTRIW